MHRTILPLLPVVLMLGMPADPAAAAAAPVETWTDPQAATASTPDFALQGEYQHPGAGLQVAALGQGKFLAVTLPGGLPGAGWDGAPTTATTLDAAALQARIASESWQPGKRVSPTLEAKPPALATVLFWGDMGQADVDREWTKGVVHDGLLNQGALTKKSFQDFNLHVEFRLPFKPQRFLGDQDRGNSGIYIFERYEVQIIDTFGLHYSQAWTGTDGGTAWSDAFAKDLGKPSASKATQWCSALYLTQVPRVNAALPPLSWQTYDIDFQAPRFTDGKKTTDAKISVRLNGIPVHQDLVLPHGTGQGGKKPEVPEGQILLQDHGNPVRFRNIWLTKPTLP